jgi:hypothetical protein
MAVGFGFAFSNSLCLLAQAVPAREREPIFLTARFLRVGYLIDKMDFQQKSGELPPPE